MLESDVQTCTVVREDAEIQATVITEKASKDINLGLLITEKASKDINLGLLNIANTLAHQPMA